MPSKIGLVFRGAAFAAANNSKWLNAALNTISGGSVNRTSLANSLLRSAVDYAAQSKIEKKSLSEREVKMIQAGKTALFNQDPQKVQEAFKDLITTAVAHYAGDSVPELIVDKLKSIASARSDVHSLHKAIAANFLLYDDGQAICDKLKQEFKSKLGGNFIARQVADLIKLTMASRYKDDVVDNDNYKLLGTLLQTAVTRDAKHITGKGAEIMLRITKGAVLSAVNEGVVEPVKQLENQGVRQAETTATLAAHANRATPEPDRSMEPVLPGAIPEDDASAQAAKPFIPPDSQAAQAQQRVDIGRSVDEAGDLASLIVKSHTAQVTSEADAAHVTGTLRERAGAREDLVRLNGYLLDAGFAGHLGQVDITFPAASSLTYTDAVKNLAGNTLSAMTGWLWKADDSLPAGRVSNDWLPPEDTETLMRLYNACGKDEKAMEMASRFLDPAVAEKALVAPIRDKIKDGLYDNGHLKMKLGPAPKFRFRVELEKDGDGIERTRIGIDAVWTVEAYGTDAQSMRKPQGNQASEMVHSACVYVDVDGGGFTASAQPLGTWTTLANEVPAGQSAEQAVA